jgi:uncharacterized protein YbjT (DUF2867 family)
MKILATGATGRFASLVVPALVNRGLALQSAIDRTLRCGPRASAVTEHASWCDFAPKVAILLLLGHWLIDNSAGDATGSSGRACR